MSKPLTAIAIDKLTPRAKRYEVADGGQRGLKLVVFPSGAKSFVVRYRFGDVKKKLTLGHISPAAARKAAAAALYEVHEGRDPAAAKQAKKAKAADAAADTVEAICRKHLKREGGQMRTVAARTYTLERLVFPAIGALPITELRRSHIVRMLDKIQDERGDRTADLALSYLRAALAWHATRTDDFNSPIVRGMGRYDNAAHERKRVLNDDEIRSIWAATEPAGVSHPFRAFTRFLLLTGARRDEARLLTWPEIKGDEWELPAARNKTNLDFIRPLSAATMALLASIPRVDDSPWVFTTSGRRPISPTAPKIAIDTCSGVKEWRWHDLRRTARTLMSRARVDPDHAEMCLGHKIGGMRGIYDRFEYYEEKAQAFDALAALIERIVTPPADVVTPLRRQR